MDDKLTLRYIPLKDAVLWDRNPKEHDIDALCESIQRYGFQDPPKYDASLQAIVYGNGRIVALQMMQQSGEPAPRGIVVDDDGNWLVPVKFGVDLPDRQTAEAFALDHNNLTMSGGDLTLLERSSIWDIDQYLGVLADLASQEALPVTVDEADVELLLSLSDLEAKRAQDQKASDAADEVNLVWREPLHRVARGEVWELGSHVLACMDVVTEWESWMLYLERGMLLAPYPGPFLLLTERAKSRRVFMVQPDPIVAGHVLDQYAVISSEEPTLLHG